MEEAPLGLCSKIPSSEQDKYVKECIKMLEKAVLDENMYEYWSKWCLWYYDTILVSFYELERPQMYEALDCALLDRNVSEAYRLIHMCIKI